MEAATGEIIAYLDDDASPDSNWLNYLAKSFQTTDCAGMGGPNIRVSGGRVVAEGVANAPGWPTHVLISDDEAEHIPGCNMAFRKSQLQEIGGFDTQFRVAGDDVDVCWRIRDRGWKLGFSPAAMVWHHCRNSIRAYWRQQIGYGRAEALIEKKWPEKYNFVGHLAWTGRVYSNSFRYALQLTKGRIYQGTWGSASYGRRESIPPTTLQALPVLPEWHLIILLLTALFVAGLWERSILLVLPLLLAAIALPLIPIVINGTRAHYSNHPSSRLRYIHVRAVTGFLHFTHPVARLRGRLGYGLTPWRQHRGLGFALPRTRNFKLWSETWISSLERLESLEPDLRATGAAVRRGDDYHHWDLEIRGGMFGSARVRMAIEEHVAGKQLVRLRCWPHALVFGLVAAGGMAILAEFAAADGAWGIAAILAALAVLIPIRCIRDSGAAMAAAYDALKKAGFEQI